MNHADNEAALAAIKAVHNGPPRDAVDEYRNAFETQRAELTKLLAVMRTKRDDFRDLYASLEKIALAFPPLAKSVRLPSRQQPDTLDKIVDTLDKIVGTIERMLRAPLPLWMQQRKDNENGNSIQ